MSGNSEERLKGRKPEKTRQQMPKTGGAFGKETSDQVISGEENRNLDNHVRRRTAGRSA